MCAQYLSTQWGTGWGVGLSHVWHAGVGAVQQRVAAVGKCKGMGFWCHV
jgi:hypothetical protein